MGKLNKNNINIANSNNRGEKITRKNNDANTRNPITEPDEAPAR